MNVYPIPPGGVQHWQKCDDRDHSGDPFGSRQAKGSGLLRYCLGRKRLGRTRATLGLTLVEVMVAVLVLGVSFGAVFFGLVKTNELAFTSRASLGAAQSVRGLSELVLTSPYRPLLQESMSQRNRGDANQEERENRRLYETAIAGFLKMPGDAQRVGNSVGLPQWVGDVDPDQSGVFPADFSLMDLRRIDGTEGGLIEFAVPVTVPVDANRDDKDAVELRPLMMTGVVRREVAYFPAPGGTTTLGAGDGRAFTGDQLWLRQVNLELTYEYRGRARTIEIVTFRAPDD